MKQASEESVEIRKVAEALEVALFHLSRVKWPAFDPVFREFCAIDDAARRLRQVAREVA